MTMLFSILISVLGLKLVQLRQMVMSSIHGIIISPLAYGAYGIIVTKDFLNKLLQAGGWIGRFEVWLLTTLLVLGI